MSRARIVLFVCLAALVLVPAAASKVWFTSIGGKTFRPGQIVRTEIIGCARIEPRCPVAGTRVGLARGSATAISQRPPWHVVGTVDRLGQLRFQVPNGTGTYHLVALVAQRWRPASRPFQVA